MKNIIEYANRIIVACVDYFESQFSLRWICFEVSFYFDVFTKEILTYKATDWRGDRLRS